MRLTVSASGSLAGWFRGRGPELLLRYHVRVARVPVVHWAHILHRPPTASRVVLGTGVLWVSTGTHPWQDDGETRAPALTYTGRRTTNIEEMWIIDVYSCKKSGIERRSIVYLTNFRLTVVSLCKKCHMCNRRYLPCRPK